MMRAWPPLLHLAVLAVILPLGWQRLAALPAGPVAAPAADASADPAAPQDLAALLAGGEGVTPDALLGRPLFAPGRQGRVVATADSPAPTEAARPEVPRMVGYLDDGTKPRAILASVGGGEEAIVREGDEFLGFRVLQVKPAAVTLRREDEEITINMFPQ